MRKVMKKLQLIIAAAICVAVLSPGVAMPWSGSSGNQGAASGPPWGVKIIDDAKGIKLTGVIIIEYVNWSNELIGEQQDYADMARVVLRLSKGNDSKGYNDMGNETKGSVLRTFYDEIPWEVSPVAEAGMIQSWITSEMSGAILDAFFPDETNLGVTVKMMNKFGFVLGNAFIPRDADQSYYEFCKNFIDDDGDGLVDFDDSDCTRRAAYTIADIQIAVKELPVE